MNSEKNLKKKKLKKKIDICMVWTHSVSSILSIQNYIKSAALPLHHQHHVFKPGRIIVIQKLIISRERANLINQQISSFHVWGENDRFFFFLWGQLERKLKCQVGPTDLSLLARPDISS